MTTKTILVIVFIYLIIINTAASLLAVIDKKKAVKNKWRIPENTLMLIGLFGGAAGEYLTMRGIHHKTRRKKFMIGLPLEIVFHIILIISIIAKAAN